MNAKKGAIFMVLVGMGCMIVVLSWMLFGEGITRGYRDGMYEIEGTRRAVANPPTAIPVPTSVPPPTLTPNCKMGWVCATSPPQCWGWSTKSGTGKAIKLDDDEVLFILDEPGFRIHFMDGAIIENRTLVEADFCRAVWY